MTHDELLAVVSYCPETGVVTRKVSAGTVPKGAIVGSPGSSNGYLTGQVLGKNVSIHRLVWFYVNGVWPTQQIDHINGVKTDNRIKNLRECDNSANNLNKHGPMANNKSGFLGVHKVQKTGRYRTSCKVNGVNHNLGFFATPEEASTAYNTFKQQHLPERV